MSALRKNVASQVLTFGLVSTATGLATAGVTFTGKAWVTGDGTQAGFAGTFTDLGNGQYKYVPTQGETNVTSFGLFIAPTSTSVIPVNIHCFTANYDTTAANLPANVTQLLGTAWVTPAVAGTPDVNTIQWKGGVIPAPNVTGVPLTDAKYLLGTIYGTPATAGVMDVNTKNINNVAAATPGAAGGVFIAGTNAATAITTGLTAHIIGTVDTLTTYTGNTPQTGDSFARIGVAGVGLTNLGDTRIANLDATITSRGTSTYAGGAVASVTGAVGSVTAGVTVTTNNDKTGYALATSVWDEVLASHLTAGSTGNALNAAGSAGDPWATALPGAYGAGTAGKIIGTNLDTTITSRASPTNITAGTITTVTNLTNAATAGDLTATMKTSVTTAATAATPIAASVSGNVLGSTGSVVGAVGSVTGAVGSVTGLTTGTITTAVLTTAMTESYRANAAAPTLAQATFETLAHLGEASITGTTKTIKKIDHSTTAETFTLDSATVPTSITRAT